MMPLLRMLLVPVVMAVLRPLIEEAREAWDDAGERRYERRRKKRIDEALVVERNRQLEDERQREMRRRSKIRQTRGEGVTPVPIPGVSDAETPEPPEREEGPGMHTDEWEPEEG